LVDAAKKEGKVTVSLPASAEMKKQVEEQFKKRYGIEVETFTARGSAAVRRMADEFKAGVRHFDLHVGGSSSIVSGMLDEGNLDPRTPGAGDSTWAFIWQVKGEEYLKKLVAQDLYLGRDQRLLAESLAKGRVAVMIGLSYYSYLPFLKAGLPIKTLPRLKEGNYGTGGSGNLAIIKGPAHPNSTKVFVNWLLGREGQEIVSKALGQATRRLDVDTRFLSDSGTIAAKDVMSVNDYLKIEHQSEEQLDTVREPAAKFAHALFK